MFIATKTISRIIQTSPQVYTVELHELFRLIAWIKKQWSRKKINLLCNVAVNEMRFDNGRGTFFLRQINITLDKTNARKQARYPIAKHIVKKVRDSD